MKPKIVHDGEVPVYPGIAEKAKHLRELGTSDRALSVSDKRVVKSILMDLDRSRVENSKSHS